MNGANLGVNQVIASLSPPGQLAGIWRCARHLAQSAKWPGGLSEVTKLSSLADLAESAKPRKY